MNKNLMGGLSLVLVIIALVLAYYKLYIPAWVVIAINAAMLFYIARRKD